MKNNKLIILLLILVLSSCYRVPNKIEPELTYVVQENYINNLPSAFEPLTEEEKTQDWGKEYLIATAFAKDFDLYRAISTYKRAEVLVPKDSCRKQEILYNIILCYYLGKKYENLIEYFERCSLLKADKSFKAFHDLLLMLYESYRYIGDKDKESKILELINKNYPETGKKLILANTLLEADLNKTEEIANTPPIQRDLTQMLYIYNKEKKSISKAQMLNAILPGAGYFYIGQKKSALTSLLLNGLFIAASYQFFHKGYVAAGLITLSFEAGWYFGGIYGAGEEAKFYNETVYETHARAVMNKDKLFPVFMLKYSF